MFQQEPQSLFMSTNKTQVDAKDMKSKRENYTIEIRNKTRQTQFQARRQQTQGESLIQEERKDQTQYNTQTQQQWFDDFLNNIDQVQQLEKMKIEVSTDFQRYPTIWQNDSVWKFMKQLLQIIEQSADNQLAYLAAYHFNNMIFYANGRLNQVMELSQLIDILIKRLQISVKVDDLLTATSVLYCLANIYGDQDIYQDERLKQVHSNLGNLLHNLVLQVTLNKQHLQFTNGFCWLLRNLAYQDATYQTFGQYALKCCDVLWPDIEKYMLNTDIGEQIAEDTLLTIKYVADKSNDDELSLFFDAHVNLMIGIVTYGWKSKQFPTVVEVLKNLTTGQDDVLENLIQLGVLDLIQQIIQDKPLSQQPCLIGVLGNFFYADDEEIIAKILDGLGREKVLSELILSLQDPYSNSNTLRTLCNLVKNFPEITLDLLDRKIVSITIQTLQSKISHDQEEDGLELLNALIEQDFSDQQCEMEVEIPSRVQQMITSSGGQLMLEQCLSSQNEQTAQWATKVLQALQVQQ